MVELLTRFSSAGLLEIALNTCLHCHPFALVFLQREQQLPKSLCICLFLLVGQIRRNKDLYLDGGEGGSHLHSVPQSPPHGPSQKVCLFVFVFVFELSLSFGRSDQMKRGVIYFSSISHLQIESHSPARGPSQKVCG